MEAKKAMKVPNIDVEIPLLLDQIHNDFFRAIDEQHQSILRSGRQVKGIFIDWHENSDFTKNTLTLNAYFI